MSQLKSHIQIVTAADNNFAMPLCVTLYSILDNVTKDIVLHFYILDGGVDIKNKKKIEKIFDYKNEGDRHDIAWIDQNNDVIDNFPLQSGMSRATYLRLFLPELLPSALSKVIYLDCDLVLESNIRNLWNIDLDGMIIGAARDLIVQNISHSRGVKNYEKYGGNKDFPYFNAGVMLINLQLWEQKNITKKSIDYLFENKDIISLDDQEALNAALIGKWKELDPRWNQQGVIFWLSVLPETEFTHKIRNMYNKLVYEPFIIHYISKSKPWNYNCMHPSTGRFMYYLKKSRWFSGRQWLFWHFGMYRKRFFWLFKDLRKTLQMVSVDTKSKPGIGSEKIA